MEVGEDKEERYIGAWKVFDVPVMQVTEEIVDMVAPVNAVPTRVAGRTVEWEKIVEAIQPGLWRETKYVLPRRFPLCI